MTFALILIDPQNGFVNDGFWSRSFSDGDSVPILQSFHHIVEFLRSIPSPSSTPILISQTGFSGVDFNIFQPIFDVLASRNFTSITRVLKPQTNLSKCSGVHSWLNDQLTNHRNDIVIGGCTITSCVRHSSIEMKKDFPQLNFLVDRHLCGARKENYFPRCSTCFDKYLIDGTPIDENCSTCRKSDVDPLKFFSPVEFAFQQMKDAGVTLVDQYSWIK